MNVLSITKTTPTALSNEFVRSNMYTEASCLQLKDNTFLVIPDSANSYKMIIESDTVLLRLADIYEDDSEEFDITDLFDDTVDLDSSDKIGGNYFTFDKEEFEELTEWDAESISKLVEIASNLPEMDSHEILRIILNLSVDHTSVLTHLNDEISVGEMIQIMTARNPVKEYKKIFKESNYSFDEDENNTENYDYE